MRLPKFELFRPSTVEETCSLLSEYKGEAKIIAGGTAALIDMGQRLFTPNYVVTLKSISRLDYIDYDDEKGLRLGALATIDSLSTSPVVRERYFMLSQAAREVGVPSLRYIGTVAGNLCLDTRCLYYNQSYFWRKVCPPCFKRGGDLCHVVKGSDHCSAVYQGDLAPALIALGAKVRLTQATGERTIPLGEFFTGDGKSPNTLEPEEVLTEVQIPPLSKYSAGAYQKFRVRGAIDYPLAGVAVVLHMDEEKVCRQAKIVLGAVASAPIEVGQAGEILRDKRIDDSLIERAAQEAFSTAHPVANLTTTPDYRRRMVKVLLKRAVNQALESVRGGG